jgi:hypothetical protein
MNIEKRSESSSALSTDDRITVSISHEIKIKGEASWVKYEANSAVREEETATQAATRVIDHVDRQVMSAVRQVVTTVNGVK